jgi:lysophospholipase L1-like esterase
MQLNHLLACAIGILCSLSLQAATVEPADAPATRVEKDGKPNAGFVSRHESFLKRGKEGPIEVLFLGDSITQGWDAAGKKVWNAEYGSLKPANFGIAGDRTQHVLWRIAQGELDGIAPKVVVLMIGTNNTPNTAEEVAKGVRAILTQIHAKLPQTRVLLLGIFPRGNDPKDAKTVSLREKIAAVNRILATYDDGRATRYLDIGAKFLDPTGAIATDIMKDGVHPVEKGYLIWAEAMRPLLSEMLQAPRNPAP